MTPLRWSAEAWPYIRVTSRLSPDAWAAIQAACRYTVPGARFSFAYKRHHWDGTKSLLVTARDKVPAFPAGLLPTVSAALAPLGFEVQVDGLPARPRQASPLSSTLPDGTHLRPDQVGARDQALKEGCALLNLATTFGKTELLAALCAAWPTERVLVLVDSRVAFENLFRLADLLKEPVATMGAGRSATPARARVLVAMVQTVAARFRATAWAEARVLLVDEVDTVSPTRWFPLLGACRAPIRLGLSGTVRDVPIPLITAAFFGKIVTDVSLPDLRASGHAAGVRVLMPLVAMDPALNLCQHVGCGHDRAAHLDDTVCTRCPCPGHQWLAYGALYERAIAGGVDRNALLLDAIQRGVAARYRCAVAVWTLEHGAWFTHQLDALGIPNAYLHGSTPLPLIEAAKRRFEAGELPVLVSTILGRAVNLPSMTLLVNAAGWKSRRVTKQRRGRLVRIKPDDSPHQLALVIDPHDQGRALLERHAKTREATYRRDGDEVRVGAWTALREGGFEGW